VKTVQTKDVAKNYCSKARIRPNQWHNVGNVPGAVPHESLRI